MSETGAEPINCHPFEFLSADPLRDAESGTLVVGFTLVDEDTTVTLCLSPDDVLMLIRQAQDALSVLAGMEKDDE